MVEPRSATALRRLPIALAGNGLVRIASGASGVLVGLYLADLANRGADMSVSLVAILGAVSFGGELIFAIPAGLMADCAGPRVVIVTGAMLGAAATQLFGMSRWVGVFFLSRAIEGLAAASEAPPLLAHIAATTAHDPVQRIRAMSWFEAALLAGLAFGGVLGAQLWRALDTASFAAVAGFYLLAAIAFAFAVPGRSRRAEFLISDLRKALSLPSVRRLAPVWLCVNTITGLWLGPALTFLMTRRAVSTQFLVGIFAADPDRIGWLLLGYSCVFASGVAAWSFAVPRIGLSRTLRISLLAMFPVCIGLLLLNHSAEWLPAMRWMLVAITSLLVMVESGFTPAALGLIGAALGETSGRGAAMGVYSLLLGVGAVAGSLLAAELARLLAFDGLICGTAALAVLALLLMSGLKEDPIGV